MRLFGFAYIHKWPALCFGSNAWCFKLIWAKNIIGLDGIAL